jgi:hypothetical protein
VATQNQSLCTGTVLSWPATRWLVKETIRYLKRSYRLEDPRVLTYERLRNLVTLVMATVYFSEAWLGDSSKLAVPVSRVKKLAKRFFGVPDFHYYALADGIRVLLSRLNWESRHRAPTSGADSSAQLLLVGST